MGRNYRIAALAVGALIASPVLALLTGPVAGGDLASIGSLEVGGYTETLNDTVTGALDNYLVGNFDGYPTTSTPTSTRPVRAMANSRWRFRSSARADSPTWTGRSRRSPR